MIDIAVNSFSNKETNQDSCSIFCNQKLQLNGIIVTDGLGSFTHAKLAAVFIADFIRQEIEKLELITDLDFEKMFKEAKKELIEYAKNEGIEIEKNSAATTVIVTVHYPISIGDNERIQIAYVGNGAVWHIRGNFNSFDEGQLLPWNAINYLNPHSIQENGQEALYKYISISDNYDEACPSILTLTVDRKFGDIIMICTDGVYSYDQVPIGKDKTGKMWISGEYSMSLFFNELNLFFKNKPCDLPAFLFNFLTKLNDDEELDDDATIGIMITDKALNFQAKANSSDETN